MGVLFGWLVNRSLPLFFALMGALILAALGVVAAADLLPSRRAGRASEQMVS